MIIEVWSDTWSTPAECRSCHAYIFWVQVVKSGKRMCFDGPNGPVAVRTRRNEADGRLIEVMDTTVTPTHWETCPDAKKWSRK